MPLTLPWSADFETDADGFTLDTGVDRSTDEAYSGSTSLRFMAYDETPRLASIELELAVSAELTFQFKPAFSWGYLQVRNFDFVLKQYYGPSSPTSGEEWNTGWWNEVVVELTSGVFNLTIEVSGLYYEAVYLYVDALAITASVGSSATLFRRTLATRMGTRGI